MYGGARTVEQRMLWDALQWGMMVDSYEKFTFRQLCNPSVRWG